MFFNFEKKKSVYIYIYPANSILFSFPWFFKYLVSCIILCNLFFAIPYCIFNIHPCCYIGYNSFILTVVYYPFNEHATIYLVNFSGCLFLDQTYTYYYGFITSPHIYSNNYFFSSSPPSLPSPGAGRLY